MDTSESITAAAAETLGILLDFIAEEFDPESLSSEDAALLEDIRARTSGFQTFVDHRLLEIGDELDSAYGLSTCPSRLQDTLVLGDITPTCLFCRDHGDGEDVARRFVESVLGESEYRIMKDGGEPLRRICPECGSESLVIDQRDSGDMHPNPQEAVCLSCGSSWGEGSLDECTDCGELFESPGGGVFQCTDCFNAYVSRDNT